MPNASQIYRNVSQKKLSCAQIYRYYIYLMYTLCDTNRIRWRNVRSSSIDFESRCAVTCTHAPSRKYVVFSLPSTLFSPHSFSLVLHCSLAMCFLFRLDNLVILKSMSHQLQSRYQTVRDYSLRKPKI